jgi:hypothetical protein
MDIFIHDFSETSRRVDAPDLVVRENSKLPFMVILPHEK